MAHEGFNVLGMAKDGQAAINEQIQDTYDIFIAIFWGRLGTPTNRAKSGTVEEFNRAYGRYKADPNSVEIMVYFKETPIRPSKIDPEQMKAVADFKQYVGKLGLYFEFDSTDSFKELVRNHLNQKIKKWTERYYGNLQPRSKIQPSSEEKLRVTDELIEEEELIEKIENSTHLIERVTFNLSHIVIGIEDLYKRLNNRNINGKKQKKAVDLTTNEEEILRTMTGAAHFLADFVYRMNFEIPLFEESLSTAMEYYTEISGKRVEYINDNSNTIQNALDTVSTFRLVTIKSNVKVKNLRKLIEGFLWKETGFERVCHNAFESIEKLLRHIENGKQQATKVETYLSELI